MITKELLQWGKDSRMRLLEARSKKVKKWNDPQYWKKKKKKEGGISYYPFSHYLI
jgi:hypothetical protein